MWLKPQCFTNSFQVFFLFKYLDSYSVLLTKPTVIVKQSGNIIFIFTYFVLRLQTSCRFRYFDFFILANINFNCDFFCFLTKRSGFFWTEKPSRFISKFEKECSLLCLAVQTTYFRNGIQLINFLIIVSLFIIMYFFFPDFQENDYPGPRGSLLFIFLRAIFPVTTRDQFLSCSLLHSELSVETRDQGRKRSARGETGLRRMVRQNTRQNDDLVVA